MTDRQRFLDRVRSRLVIEPPENLPHPLVEVAEVPLVDYARNLDDLPAAFTRAAERVGTRVVRIPGTGELRDVLTRVVEEHGIRSAVASGDPEASTAAADLEALGVAVRPFDGVASCTEADLGVTGASWAIAATGTVVADAGRAGGRAASLLPPVHLAVVPMDRLVATAGDVFRRMSQIHPDGPPSQLVLITGPSRSGDIELQLTVGVHGPKHVVTVLVG